MSFHNFKTNSYCVGGGHRSSTNNIGGEITFNKKTGREIKLLVGKCALCSRQKSMLENKNIKESEGLGDLFKTLGKKGLNVSKKMAKNVLKNPGHDLDITANIATAATSKNPKNVMSTLPELISFYNTGKRLYLGKFVQIMLYKWTKNVIEYTHLRH